MSSGYKINRAADDAASLTISEKIRFLIRGLKQGSDNIGEGIDLVKTADGALEEVQSMLQRMNELTVQGLNGTNCTQDRDAVQKEIDQLYTEICRVAQSTEYNTKKILMGDPIVTRTIKAADKSVTHVVPAIATKALKLPDWIGLNGSADGSDSMMTLGGTMLTQQGNEGVSYKSVQAKDLSSPDGLAWITDIGSGLKEPVYETKSNGIWSQGMDNNYSAYIDFSALAGTTGTTLITNKDGSQTGVNNIYQRLANMVATGFYTTCSTCSRQYNIIFDSKNVDFEYRINDEKRRGANIHIDLDPFLERAKKLDPSDSTQAEKLTKDLLDFIVEETNKNVNIQGHYTRLMSTTQTADPYKLIVYDFRDYTDDPNDPLYGYAGVPNEDRGIGMVGSLSGDIIYYNTEMEVLPGATFSYEEEEALTIQHGDDGSNYSTLHLPNLPAIFEDYAKFGYNSVKESLSLVYRREEGPEIIRAQDDEEPNMGDGKKYMRVEVEGDIIPAHEEIRRIADYLEQEVWENGEYKGKKKILTGYKEEKVWIPQKVERYVAYIRIDEEKDPKTGKKEYSVKKQQIVDNLNYGMLDVIDNLIDKVSYMRTDLGAKQNALEHARNYNEIARENETAAESQIRDTDVAKEAMSHSQSNILEQAGQSMLAQANSDKEFVLRLLQQ